MAQAFGTRCGLAAIADQTLDSTKRSTIVSHAVQTILYLFVVAYCTVSICTVSIIGACAALFWRRFRTVKSERLLVEAEQFSGDRLESSD